MGLSVHGGAVSGRPPILVLVMAAAFVLLVAALLIGSFTRPEFPPYQLTVPRPTAVGDTLVGPATYTLDASSTEHWHRFAFARNSAVDAGAWDVAFRRFHLIAAPGGGIRDLGAVPFDSVALVPPDGYLANDVAPRLWRAHAGREVRQARDPCLLL